MMAQLDPEAGDMLLQDHRGHGHQGAAATRSPRRSCATDGRITHLEFKDGSTLETDMVVVSAGIRPITEIATAVGPDRERAHRLRRPDADQRSRTSSRSANASSIAASSTASSIRSGSRRTSSRTSSPARNPDAAYLGSKLGTKLKVMGVELASMGETKPRSADDEVVVYREPARGIYKKLIVRGGQIAGAILLGDIEAAGTLMQMFMAGTPGAGAPRRPAVRFADAAWRC